MMKKVNSKDLNKKNTWIVTELHHERYTFDIETSIYECKTILEILDELAYYGLENKIEKYMIKKLTKKEMEYVKSEIQYYSQAPLEELEEKIKFETQINHYQDLSMVDAFILHFIVKIYHQIEDVKINKEINSQIKANEAMHQKGLHYANHSVVKK